jgi:class 3 adenylate cyclase/tetratricopeptide (TPR) repeat protein
MTFEELLDQAIALLQRRGRVTYRALQRQFNLDDDYLADLKAELIEAQRLAVDEHGTVLVWTGSATSVPPPTAGPARAAHRVPQAYTPAYLSEKILASRAALTGERKQVTVLFADIKDSTELIRGLDPEAAQQLLDPALQRMMDAVHRFEGTVNQVLGDGIMALFGAPIAHEDHALRACYAALAMQAAMRAYTDAVRQAHGCELHIRVGLNSGAVVVRAIGNDLHMDYSAVGETTHLAARMEQLALPGTIRLTPATLGLVEGLVRVHALGLVPVKGLDAPVEVFELTGASGIRHRLQAAVARGLTRFVGRQSELEALSQALAQAGAGQGQLVAVVGEAGVGKSRLAYECVHSHRTQGWLVLESASVSYGKATPYFPVIDLLRRYTHLEEHDAPRTIRAKVTGHVLTLDETLQETVPALLSLLDALPTESPFAQLEPAQRRHRTLTALKRVLLRESQVQPVLLVCEDLHWIDTETQALLDSLVESLPTVRLLLLVNYRPEYQHGWGSKTYYAQLRLDPLPPEGAEDFLRGLLGDDPSLAPLKRLLIARTEGNPFFLEESVRTLVETGVLVGAPGAYRLAQPLDSLQMPATVQAVLAARIDRLPPDAKRLLQTAAVIGTEVPLALLQAIAALPEAALHRGLAHLQAAEFLYETRLFPEQEYTFKHALTHEVAYSGLLLERRRTLHAQIVEALERLYPDRLAEQAERLAQHTLRGAVWDKAVAYCRQAGSRALARWANGEAVACFEQALEALQHLPEQRHTVEQAIDLRCDLRNALARLGEHERALDYLHEAETLAQALEDQRRLGQVAAFITFQYTVMGEYHQAVVSAQQTLASAEALGDFPLQVQGNFYLGQAYHRLGDYHRATDLLRSNVASLEGERLYGSFGTAGLPSVTSRSVLAHCLMELGGFAEAIALGEEAVRIAEAVNQPGMLASACRSASGPYLRKGDFPKAIPLLERGVELCRAGLSPRLFADLAAALGAAYAWAKRPSEALPLLEQAMAPSVLRQAFQSAVPFLWVSEAYRLIGREEDARQRAEHAFEHARDHDERGHQAWALWLLGEIAAHRPPPEVAPAEAAYRQALALAGELGMRPLQAHCHHGLGTLYATLGQQEQARAELSAAIALYRAMDMQCWLPQAEGRLAQSMESAPRTCV